MRIFPSPAHQLVGVASICSAVFLAAPAEAACLSGSCSQNGLVFSAASGSFNITDVTGTGTQTDPFIVYQDVRGLDISLAVSGLPNAKQHSIFNRPGFALSVVSRNLTGAFWRFYDHELQEVAGLASSENDGLSFAQGIGPIRPYTSSGYGQADEVTDVRDFINFYRGSGVNPGETVRFNYYITDTIPNQQFFIRQRPDFRTNTVPTETIQRLQQKPTEPTLQPPQPAAPIPSINQPPVPSTPPMAKLPEKRQQNAQSIPEPSTLSLGILAIVFGKWGRRNQKAHLTKP
ncbi:MAG: hypothetical protein AAF579_14910 [Cyanobacteria bacterium P01_C01_bin.118]